MLPSILTFLTLVALKAAGLRSPQHVGMTNLGINQLNATVQTETPAAHHNHTKIKPQYLTKKTKKFAVNGSAIPFVDWDIGESYAGYLPTRKAPLEGHDDNLFFWFFPSLNPNATDEITIWLNGGPGCSSMIGVLEENGPFTWGPGTRRPVRNPYAWSNLTNIVYIDQPLGTGYSFGSPHIVSEYGLARAFLGFWANFMHTFDLKNRKVYITGESYAGMYAPYIAEAMLLEHANDTSYYNLAGLLLIDPVIAPEMFQMEIPARRFLETHSSFLGLEPAWLDAMAHWDQECGYTEYMERYLTFPPNGTQPEFPDLTCGTWTYSLLHLQQGNPCFDVYNIANHCPVATDPLGDPNDPHPKTYFDRADVKKALHVTSNETWYECSPKWKDVFVDGLDRSPMSAELLPSIIEHTNNVIVAHGALDYILIANGTLLTLQNLTWGGELGFCGKDGEKDFYVPYLSRQLEDDWDKIGGARVLAGSGVMGKTRSERGLTWVEVAGAGHMIPQFQPGAGYRLLEKLLSRVNGLDSRIPFSTDPVQTYQD